MAAVLTLIAAPNVSQVTAITRTAANQIRITLKRVRFINIMGSPWVASIGGTDEHPPAYLRRAAVTVPDCTHRNAEAVAASRQCRRGHVVARQRRGTRSG